MKQTAVHLAEKIQKAQDIIKKAYASFPPEKTVVAWTGGKDSTVLLHIIKNTFSGTVPFPVVFNDSTMEFDEIYSFINRITATWRLQLVVIRHDEKELLAFHSSKSEAKKFTLSRLMKIHSIEKFQTQHGIRAFFAGIRWDEHPARSSETYFSKRKNHTRIHPILHFTEQDVWEYIKAHNVPYVSLYKKGYRSLGEKPFTKKSAPGGGERSGREQNKEKLMDKLRAMGYW